ncbi:MAG: DNA polymerase III subunit delta [Flavobacteriales bacterium]|jgi:DNA polymerase-3 subunit delta|nr:DNA polymerase III subunit delta [Flavobacteriales bacterium]NBW72192.1 DNA polymerase III subunit delta [Flavobacteriia bacterium]
MDHKLLLKEIRNKKFEKIYFLHGEEPYFIDVLTKAIQDNALEESERDFNQSILYGKDAEVLSLISELKSYPMMAERRLVILKEAQYFKAIEQLESYLENPANSTIFVICYKYKTFDARKKTLKNALKNGVVFKSEKVKEYQLAEWIQQYIKTTGYELTSKACMLLIESLGNDLGRIVKELEKLAVLIEKGTIINENHIEENIGISKDYNVFELTNAVANKDNLKALKIVDYFEHNPKAADLVFVISNLFKFFSQIMRIHFLPNKSREAVARALGVHPFVAGELTNAKNKYDPRKIAANIALIHEYDLKSKGVGNTSATQGELMREMVYQLIH